MTVSETAGEAALKLRFAWFKVKKLAEKKKVEVGRLRAAETALRKKRQTEAALKQRLKAARDKVQAIDVQVASSAADGCVDRKFKKKASGFKRRKIQRKPGVDLVAEELKAKAAAANHMSNLPSPGAVDSTLRVPVLFSPGGKQHSESIAPLHGAAGSKHQNSESIAPLHGAAGIAPLHGAGTKNKHKKSHAARRAMKTSVYINDIHNDADEADLLDVFRAFGGITNYLFLPNKGYGIVQYESHEEAQLSLEEMEDTLISGSVIHTRWAESSDWTRSDHDQGAASYDAVPPGCREGEWGGEGGGMAWDGMAWDDGQGQGQTQFVDQQQEAAAWDAAPAPAPEPYRAFAPRRIVRYHDLHL